MSQELSVNAAAAARAGRSWWQQFAMILKTLGAGASTVPFGDNGDVFRALGEVRARTLCGSAK